MNTWQASAAAVAPSESSRGDADARPIEEAGHVRIARRVLRTVVREAALGVSGVTRLVTSTSMWPSVLGRPLPRDGVGLIVRGDTVSVDLYLVVESGLNLVVVGEAVQDAVGAAIEHILGMGVSEINIFVQDVA
jgi:uncharacterized alkaline shock family protein YloU